MKLFFTNEDYYYKAMLILNSDCRRSIDRNKAFLLLVNGLPFNDIENLCIEVSMEYNITTNDAYLLIQQGRVNNLLDIAFNLIDKDNGEVDPVWTCWDSLNIGKLLSDVEADMVFSCPPYADLEVYSDDPKDLSNMEYAKFKEVYSKIISETCNKLK